MIAQSLDGAGVSKSEIFQVCAQAYASDPDLLDCTVSDINAVKNRDPASSSLCEIFLFLKGPKVLESLENFSLALLSREKSFGRLFSK